MRFKGNFQDLAENFPVAYMSREPWQMSRRVGPGLLLELPGNFPMQTPEFRSTPSATPMCNVLIWFRILLPQLICVPSAPPKVLKIIIFSTEGY